MKNIFVIAKNTFKLEIRDRIFYLILGFALGYIFLTLFLSKLVLNELPMIKSFSLVGIYFFNAVLAIFLGTTIFSRDLEQKTVYFLLAKPVSRRQFILGKFVGLCFVVFAAAALLAAAYIGVIFYQHGGFDLPGLAAVFFQCVELALFLSFAIFASTFSSSLASVLYTSSAFFIGHVVSALLEDARAFNISGAGYFFLQILYYALPNLEKFDIRSIAVHGSYPSPVSAAVTLGYAVAYATLLLAAASFVFEKREL